ncbi:MAG TPA: TIGR03086 family metal-binding protein [Mycobacteriales bacterium]|jgi:uncharacterized protein (TIGR03086 family)|nr:TIGR03086 family metal-binding protein [Mycobacteriales bacterium]
MNDLRERFERAQRHFGELVHDVKPDQWSDPTPCTQWDVRALVNHLVYEARWLPSIMAGKTIAEVGDAFEGDLLGDNPESAYDAALREASASVAEVDLDRIVHLSFGDLPASEYLTQVTSDFVVHGWDLARGIGANDTMDPDLVAFVQAAAEPQADMLVASGLFGTPVDVPADADPQTKLLALFGRRA